jgi:hypothetical protein
MRTAEDEHPNAKGGEFNRSMQHHCSPKMLERPEWQDAEHA